MLTPLPPSPTARAATRALLVGLLLFVPALGAQSPCGPTNPRNWCAHQDSPGVNDDAEPDERFGAALAFGDFNNDGFDDLAVGVPNEEEVGAVHVFFGSATGLTLTGQLFFSQNNVSGTDEGAETGDEFGFALATGDFNGDGFDDLVVGSPGEDLPEINPANCSLLTCEDTGGVHVIPGSASGLQLGSATFHHHADLDELSNFYFDGTRTGAVLAAGELSIIPDGFDDLVVAGPFRDIPDDRDDSGEITSAFGSASGLVPGLSTNTGIAACEDLGGENLGSALALVQTLNDGGHEIVAGAPGCTIGTTIGAGTLFVFDPFAQPVLAELVQSDYSTAGNGVNDHFGASLAAGDFDDDGFIDLAASAPGKNHGAGSPNDSGRVYVAYSDASGPDPSSSPDLIGEDEWPGQTPAAGENFGEALAAGDVTGDGFDDLLMGAPGEGAQGGFLFLKKGSPTGLTTVGNEVISQGFIGGVTEAGDRFGAVLALGDVNGDGILEVAVGVPLKNLGADTDAGMVYVTDLFGPLLFADGFESGNTSAWAVVVP